MLKIVGLLVRMNEKGLLRKIVRESYGWIRMREMVTFNLTLERVFGLGVMGCYGELPAGEVLEGGVGEDMGEMRGELVLRMLSFRDIFERECEQMVQV